MTSKPVVHQGYIYDCEYEVPWKDTSVVVKAGVIAKTKTEAEKVLYKKNHAIYVRKIVPKQKIDEWYLDRWYSRDPSSYLQEWNPEITAKEMIEALIKNHPRLARIIIQ